MKIFSLFSTPQEKEPTFIVWPDSCLLLSDRPLYVPDFAPEFVAVPMAAYKAGRLGKNIAPRFASRYLTEFTAALCIMPRRALEALSEGAQPSVADTCFDTAVVMGDWTRVTPDNLELTCHTLDCPSLTIPWPDGKSAADSLAAFSMRNTIKMGDILMTPLPTSAIPVAEGDRISIFDADTRDTLLTTRFK